VWEKRLLTSTWMLRWNLRISISIGKFLNKAKDEEGLRGREADNELSSEEADAKI
jgi:hypothetical protein